MVGFVRYVISSAVLAGLALTAQSSFAQATSPLPRPAKSATGATAPAPVAQSGRKGLSGADEAALADAFKEVDRKNWPEAMRQAARLKDETAAKIIQWMRLISENSGATLAEIVTFSENNPTWPRQAILNQRAEEAVLFFPSTPEDLSSWFSAQPPVTGEGKIAYARALMATGKQTEGIKWVRDAWINNDFSVTRQKEIQALYGKYLSGDTNRARLNRLIEEGAPSDATRLAASIGGEAQALTDARLKLHSLSSAGPAAVSRLPSSLKNDAGVLYDRVRYERKRGDDDAVLPLLLTASKSNGKAVTPETWWVERKIAARQALTEGKAKEAYEIVKAHGMTSGADFAEAEFMAGWIALQYLNKPAEARAHFSKLKNNVTAPISKARGEYWLARANSAQGMKPDAIAAYKRAAAFPTTFYGQLAIAALASEGHDNKLRLPQEPRASSEAKARFKSNELVHAAYILHEADRPQQLWTFMMHLADTLNDIGELGELSDLAAKFGETKLSLRIAKTASQRGFILPERAYPTSFMPSFTQRGPSVEKALVYGLTRQESEFDPLAYSSAGARGLMQLMPATAKITAKQIGTTFVARRLEEPSYNVMLGAAHLGTLIDGYTGSYIMSIAAYNAGANRVGQWTDQFGDPRSINIDPIDWIENIPFSETRNYVQRVLENTGVYRTRLSGSAQKIKIDEDIRRNTGMTITSPSRIPTAASATAPTVPNAVPIAAESEAAPADADDDEADKPAPHIQMQPIPNPPAKSGKQ